MHTTRGRIASSTSTLVHHTAGRIELHHQHVCILSPVLGFGVVSKSRSLRRRFGLLELRGLSSRLGHILWEFWAALGIRFGKLEKLSLSLSTWDWRGWRSFRGSFSGFVELGLWADWVAWDLDFGFLELRGLIFLAHFLKSLSFLGGWIWKNRRAQTQFI